jgi:Uma2 family endonuclease
VPRPDVLVVCGENPDDKKILITPVLIFEILSPSTEQKDKE